MQSVKLYCGSRTSESWPSGSADGAHCLEGHYSLGVVLSCLLPQDSSEVMDFHSFAWEGRPVVGYPFWLEGWWIALGTAVKLTSWWDFLCVHQVWHSF